MISEDQDEITILVKLVLIGYTNQRQRNCNGKILYESKQTQRFEDWYGKLQDLNDAKLM